MMMINLVARDAAAKWEWSWTPQRSIFQEAAIAKRIRTVLATSTTRTATTMIDPALDNQDQLTDHY